MSPEEFKQRAREICDERNGYAGEMGHREIDMLLDECLESLGYGEGLEILNSMSGFYYS